ncbi:N-acetylmuramoyl-L-alanine amidase [Auraticoccus monumenti]|uniref:LGFP repeat-containing protein n=1 Tax=Auraticoccus monumenti TaxID=675864 RepID=A0A1G7D436_9ACTN|nr:N-acetylmuramoyl-L-alanine amidase [Auraticoccus monumenti]SDE45495.1 LGFP repeat-containing protein [Auraticoccus monumenti]
MDSPTTHPRALLRRSTALGAAALLLGGLAAVHTLPAQAEVDTPVTEVSLEAPGTGGRSQQRTTERSQTQQQTEQVGEVVLAELPQQEVEEFSTLGVTWDAASEGPAPTVQFRTRTDGDWTGWATAEDAAQDAVEEEGEGRTGTDPVYVGPSDAVQVRLTGTSGSRLVEPRLALVEAEETSADSRLITTAAAAAAPGMAPRPAYVSRKGWGADESKKECETYTGDTIQGAIVHHTAGINSYTKAQSASIVRGIYAYHTQTLGWCDIGYNFLIDKYGQVFEGRSGGVDKPVHGAHATSWNTDTVGISFMGNYETAAAPSVMLEAGAKVLAWKFDAYYRDPLSKVTLAGKYINRISGHGDVMSTACPGTNVRSKMTWLRERVNTLVGSRTTPNFTRWQALGGGKGDLGEPYLGERVVADGRVTEFAEHQLYSAGTRSYLATGAIGDTYRTLGGPTSAIGFPVSDEYAYPRTGYRANRFEDGAIIWSGSTGAHLVRAGFWHTYRDNDTYRSFLGGPTGPETRHSTLGVSVQDFQGGRLFWNGGTKVLRGGVATHYKKLSATAQASRGIPTGLETVSASKGVAKQTLTKSTMFWVGGKVVETYGGINTAYVGVGAEASRLGLPVSTEKSASDGTRYSDFEGGRITWRSGKAVVSYK